MNEKRNLFNLVDIVSAQTQIEPRIVKKFITQLFKEIEKELVNSSYIQIDDLGIFRIIKSLSSEKILFLGSFRGDATTRSNTKERVVVDSTHNTKKTEEYKTSPPFEYYDEESYQPSPSGYNYSYDKAIADTPSVFLETEPYQDDSKNEEQDYSNNSPSDDESVITYSEWEDNKKKLSNKAKTFGLSIVTIVALIIILYFLYPNDNESKIVLPYVEVLNIDTEKYLRVIRTESSTDFVTLSRFNYGYEVFWPYIYAANENDSVIPLEIKAGTIIKIPKMSPELVDFENDACVDSVKRLNLEIISKIKDVNSATRNAASGYQAKDSLSNR